MSDQPTTNGDNQPDHNSNAESALQIANVLKIIVPAILLIAVVFILFGVFDGFGWVSNALKPSRVKVTGQVFYNGEPLVDAQILTRPLTPGLKGSIAVTDQQGNFSLKTDINGDFLEGAYACEHQVTVVQYDASVSRMAAPPLLTPAKYAAFETSPLQISVEEGQTVRLELEGEPANPPTPPGSQPDFSRMMRPPGAPPSQDEDTSPDKADDPAGEAPPADETP